MPSDPYDLRDPKYWEANEMPIGWFRIFGHGVAYHSVMMMSPRPGHVNWLLEGIWVR